MIGYHALTTPPNPRQKNMKALLTPFILLLALPVLGGWDAEQVRITYLLNRIAEVEGEFIRNGTAHQPAEAVDHLRMKLERALDSWFAPPKEEWTAEMFIEKLASKSSISGRPYRIRFYDGREVDAGLWLFKQLDKM